MSTCVYEQMQGFFRRIDMSGGPDACWPWTGCTAKDGYGQVRINGQLFLAHRLAYVWLQNSEKTELEPGYVVRHLCNNPACCNPKHLTIGTHADNVADRVAAGRSATGEANGRSKLTEEQVVAMRSLHGKGVATIAELATLTGVSKRAVRFVVNGEHWKEVDGVAN